jgi:hypothetical protein
VRPEALRSSNNVCFFIETGERPASRNKTRCNRTYTAHSKATQRKAKLDKKPKTLTHGAQIMTEPLQSRAGQDCANMIVYV